MQPVKVTWHKTQYGWKGVGLYRNYEVTQRHSKSWSTQVISAMGELVETWHSRSLKQAKSEAFQMETQIKNVRIQLANNIMKAILDE